MGTGESRNAIERRSRLILAALAGATVVAVGLRAAFVGDQSLGYEEVFTASVAGHASIVDVWHAVRATESTPPLYYLLTWLWLTIGGGHSAVALRMVSVLAGSAAVPVAFLAMRRLVGDRLAVVVSWLFAISPLLLEYSIYARSYAVLILLTTFSLWALAALLERPSRARWILWGFTATALLWTHYFAAFLVIAQGSVLFVRLRADRVRLLVCSAAIAAGAAPLVALFLAQRRDSAQFFFITARPLHSRLADVARQFAIGTNVPSGSLEAAGILLAGAALVVGAAGTRRRDSTRLLAAIALVAGGLPIVAALTGIGDYLLPRNLVAVSICLAPLLAAGLTRRRSIPLAAYSAVCIAAILAGQTDWRYHGSADWEGAANRVRAAAAGEPIAVMPAMELAVAGRYLHRAPLRAPIATTDLWVTIQPARGAHQRALGPVADPPLRRLWGPQFSVAGELDYRGFRMIHLHWAAPSLVTPAPAPYNGPATAPLVHLLGPMTNPGGEPGS